MNPDSGYYLQPKSRPYRAPLFRYTHQLELF